MFYRRLLISKLVLLVSVLLLSACGGGGGGSSTDASLTVSISSFSFSAENGGTLPATKYFSYTSTNPAATQILIGVPANSTKPSWLNYGISGNQLWVGIVSTNLSAGTYNATIRVATGRADNTLVDIKDIPLTYTVTPKRVLSVSPTNLTFTEVEGLAVASQDLQFTDSTGSLPGWSSSIVYSSGSNWLTLTPSGDRSSISVGVTPEVAGTYQASIRITYNTGGANKLLTIPVTYTSTSIASVSSNSLVFSDVEGNLPAKQTVNVSFAGGANPTWNATASYINSSGWLNLTKTGNSLDVQVALLLPGTYQANISISYSTALGTSEKIIPVSYVVSAGVSVTQASITVNAVEGEDPTSIPIGVNYTGSGTLSWTTSITYISGSGWLNVTPRSGSALPANLNMDLLPVMEGSYSANVTIQYSYGTVTGSKVIPVTYNSSSAWSLPTEMNFTIDSATIAADLLKTISIGVNGANLSWNATTNAAWINLSPVSGESVSNNQLAISLVNAEVGKLKGSNHTAIITLTPNEANVTPAQITVNLAISLPVVNYVAPYIAYTDTVGSDYVILRGVGFTGLTQDVKFGTQLATNVIVISDTELHVTPPVLTAGRYIASINSPLNISFSQAELVVKVPTSYSNQTITTNFGSSNRRIFFDAERNVVFESRCYFCGFSGAISSKVIKYQFNSTSNLWEPIQFDYPLLVDIGLTPDGKELLVLTSNQILHVDPDTMGTNKVVNILFNPLGTAYQMAVLNSGMVLFRSGRATYNLVDGNFGSLGDLGGLSIDVSPDGSRATGGSADNSGTLPIKYYDASTDIIITSGSFYYYQRGMMDTHATRLFSSNNLFDENLNFIGNVNTSSLFGAITPDGQKIYGASGTTVNVIDVTGFPPFNVIGTLSIEEIGQMVLSPDENTLFIVGANYFMVRDTSTVVPAP